jgi:putative transposase
MPRPPRPQIAGGRYHITIRGNNRGPIFLDDDDREMFVRALGEAKLRHGWIVHAYCLMPNHYHLAIETPDPNIGDGMRWLNSTFSHRFNQRHRRVGHLFQRRYGHRLLEDADHYMEVIRYIPLNPVRGDLCRRPEDYRWSNYRAMLGIGRREKFLSTLPTLRLFDQDLELARIRYREWVEAAIGTHPKGERSTPLNELIRPGRLVDRPSILQAREDGYSLAEIARHLGVTPPTVRRRLSTTS